MAITYSDAGVDVAAGEALVSRFAALARGTRRPGVVGELGGFGGLFSLAEAGRWRDPILVSGTDGVGTKLELAVHLDRHDTIGIDLVAMCVNDILTAGAEPLFFLDYLATGRLRPEVAEAIVRGVADGCREAGCALLGGETAEMPGFYAEDRYDLAGFAVGVVERAERLDGGRAQDGDAVIGIGSSGIHSNGLSLARRVLDWQRDPAIAEVLLRPTRIYSGAVRALLADSILELRALAHITGGGLVGNLPRALPSGLGAALVEGSWPIPEIFDQIERAGPVERSEMWRTFNMGVGLCAVVPHPQAGRAIEVLQRAGERAWLIGRLRPAQTADRVGWT